VTDVDEVLPAKWMTERAGARDARLATIERLAEE
jgi:hypothetical protein